MTDEELTMPLKRDDKSRRYIELSVEVPGTPEQVWQAIATGPGISAWFVPTQVEEREGGAISFELGAGVSSNGQVTEFAPPHRFVYEESGWSGEAPPLATEVVVETKGAGTCLVRMVSSLFTRQDDWDDELEGMEQGWLPFLEVLRIYVRDHAGEPSASLRLMGSFDGSVAEAHANLMAVLGMSSARQGELVHSDTTRAPRLAGSVERAKSSERQHELVVHLTEPAPGLALMGTATWAGKVMVTMSVYFYGPDARDTLQREEPNWQALFARHFPTPG
jgi:uncharacterized protein YndB with AHSA1/START domain